MKESFLTFANVLTLLCDGLKSIGCYTTSVLLLNTLRRLNISNDVNMTMGISSKEELTIGRHFWCNVLETENDAKTVLIHELMHHILGDTKRLNDLKDDQIQLANIAMDMRINSWICHQYSVAENYEMTFFEKFYKSNRGLSFLLKPNSQLEKTSLRKYQKLYHNVWKEKMIDYDVIFSSLELLIPKIRINIKFIGSHSKEGQKPLDKNFLESLRGSMEEDLERNASTKGCGQGKIDPSQSILNTIKTQLHISRKLLSVFCIEKNVNVLKSFFPVKKKCKSILPINPSNRDLFRLSIGNPPLLWSSKRAAIATNKKSIAIYLDVSGSTTEHMPKILGLIARLDPGIKVIHQFSTKVVDGALSDLAQGKIDSTGGTNFNCVAEHILSNSYRKCIIFTDGDGHLGQSFEPKLRECLQDCAIILFSKTDEHYAKRLWLYYTYKKFLLDEVVS